MISPKVSRLARLSRDNSGLETSRAHKHRVSRCLESTVPIHETSRDQGPVSSRDVSCPGLLRTQTRQEAEQILVRARVPPTVPSEERTTQVGGLECRAPKPPVGELPRSMTRRAGPSRRQLQAHRHAHVLGDSGYQGSYTWASGIQGSIFSLPAGSPIARPRRVACACGSENNLRSPGHTRQHSASHVRGGGKLLPIPTTTPYSGWRLRSREVSTKLRRDPRWPRCFGPITCPAPSSRTRTGATEPWVFGTGGRIVEELWESSY